MSARRLPLFACPAARELAEVEAERAQLIVRLRDLPVHSRRRHMLEGRLEALTLRALKLELEAEQ